jgi:hypothetical protein
MPKSALQFGSYDYHDQVERGVHPPAMFATAPEIIRTHNLDDAEGADLSKEDLLIDKLDEADSRPGMTYEEEPEESQNMPPEDRQSGWYGGLTQRIKENGYDWSKPVQVRAHGSIRHDQLGSTLYQGHHRLAVMNRDRPEEFLPLQTGF